MDPNRLNFIARALDPTYPTLDDLASLASKAWTISSEEIAEQDASSETIDLLLADPRLSGLYEAESLAAMLTEARGAGLSVLVYANPVMTWAHVEDVLDSRLIKAVNYPWGAVVSRMFWAHNPMAPGSIGALQSPDFPLAVFLVDLLGQLQLDVVARAWGAHDLRRLIALKANEHIFGNSSDLLTSKLYESHDALFPDVEATEGDLFRDEVLDHFFKDGYAAVSPRGDRRSGVAMGDPWYRHLQSLFKELKALDRLKLKRGSRAKVASYTKPELAFYLAMFVVQRQSRFEMKRDPYAKFLVSIAFANDLADALGQPRPSHFLEKIL